jgi:Trk-type K+ transport system membrane component
MWWYIFGVIVFFVLSVFYIALINNEKLIEKYSWVRYEYNLFSDFSGLYQAILSIAAILWPVTIIVAFISIIGYYLFKIFSKLIDYFVK